MKRWRWDGAGGAVPLTPGFIALGSKSDVKAEEGAEGAGPSAPSA